MVTMQWVDKVYRNLKVCEHFHTLSRDGRGSGRPKGIAVGSLLQMVRDMAPPSNFNSDLRPEVMPERTFNLPSLPITA